MQKDIWVQQIPPWQTEEQFYGYIQKEREKKIYKKKTIEIKKEVIEEIIEEKIITTTSKISQKKVDIFKIKNKKNRMIAIKNSSRRLARAIKLDILFCEKCGIEDRKMEVHHKDRNPLNNSIDNLIKLCIFCHYNEHKDENISKIMMKRIKQIID